MYINGYSARKANRRSLVKVGTLLQLHHGPEDSLVVIIEYEDNYNEAKLDPGLLEAEPKRFILLMKMKNGSQNNREMYYIDAVGYVAAQIHICFQ